MATNGNSINQNWLWKREDWLWKRREEYVKKTLKKRCLCFCRFFSLSVDLQIIYFFFFFFAFCPMHRDFPVIMAETLLLLCHNDNSPKTRRYMHFPSFIDSCLGFGSVTVEASPLRRYFRETIDTLNHILP